MTPDQLKQTLDLEYCVLDFVDLADISENISSVFKIFKSHHKETFNSNERIVFYSEFVPDSKLVKHIRQAADLIDISRCFILICCPPNNESLFQSSNNYDLEYYPTTVSSKKLPKNPVTISDTLCPYPWMHLSVLALGEIRPCCVSNDVIGSIKTKNLNDVFYGPEMTQLRTSFLAGEKPNGCSNCWTVESQNITSVRQWALKYYSQREFYSDWIDQPKIRSLDLRPSNVCNFKCRICRPKYSSLYNAEQIALTKDPKKITELKSINIEGKWFDDNEEFTEQLINLLPNLVNIDVYGGEPFLLKQLPKVLQRATELGCAKDIRLHFSTNGSIFPVALIPYFQNFKLVDVCFSIDNIGQKFEYERGGSWEEVSQNIELFKNESTVNFNISLMTTVNIQNVFYLDELFDWAYSKGYLLHLNMLENSKFLNIDYMTDSAKKLVIEKYQNHPNPELQKIYNRVKNSVGSNGVEFVEYMQQLDKYRQQSFLDSHYEIAIAMGYTV